MELNRYRGGEEVLLVSDTFMVTTKYPGQTHQTSLVVLEGVKQTEHLINYSGLCVDMVVGSG